MIVVMCIMMEVVLIMMEVICITCGMMEFGLHCCVAPALAGIEGRGYHNPLKCSPHWATHQEAFSHQAVAVCACADARWWRLHEPAHARERTFPENSSRTHAAACFD